MATEEQLKRWRLDVASVAVASSDPKLRDIAVTVQALLDHIAGQAEALAAAREAERVWQDEAMQARQLAATMNDNWHVAQAAAAAMRSILAGQLDCAADALAALDG